MYLNFWFIKMFTIWIFDINIVYIVHFELSYVIPESNRNQTKTHATTTPISGQPNQAGTTSEIERILSIIIRIPSNLHNHSFSSFVLMCRVVLSSIFSNIPFKQTSANWTIIHLSFCTPFHHDIVPSWIISSDLKHSTKVTQLKILIYNKSIINPYSEIWNFWFHKVT